MIGMFIATPMYGGQATMEYVESIVALGESLALSGVAHDFLFTANESLITRARDTSAARFLESDYSHLLFIDADIRFSPEDVSKIWNIAYERGPGIFVGAYPMKRDDMPWGLWRDGKLVTDLDKYEFPVEVDYAGTGFMLIDRKVFETLMPMVPSYREGHFDRKIHAFFQDPVENGVHLSEDYFFCQKARDAGYEIIADPTIRLGHVGRRVYAEIQDG